MPKRRLVFYDRQSHEITDMEWHRLLSNQDYVFVRETRGAHNRKEPWVVLTLWLGFDVHGAMPPQIFETSVSVDGGTSDLVRCATEASALYWHDLFVREKWREEDV